MNDGVQLFDYQVKALTHMHNGCILNGNVGSGKSRTGVGYYYIMYGGRVNTKNYVKMHNPPDLYIITTATKRDRNEWETDLAPYKLSVFEEKNYYKNKVIVDSWNNIPKYTKVKNAFFIFDEQRVVGYGTWTAAFLTIVKSNKWILLSATPGDTWMDYIPVFIANGYYKNKTDFVNRHVIFSRFTTYPKVDRFINTGRLLNLKRMILIDMEDQRKTVHHKENVMVTYDKVAYKYIKTNRWNIYKQEPIKNAGEYCLVLRRLVNSDISRQIAVIKILQDHPKAIIFYSYDYELEILRELLKDYPYSEWNGHKHEPIKLNEPRWAYLVEYTAGCEGWNCIETDTIIFYSQNYSYKVMVQASGRIDRLNTPYTDLYYYHLKSDADIDKAISSALTRKKKFNEKKYAPDFADNASPIMQKAEGDNKNE